MDSGMDNTTSGSARINWFPGHMAKTRRQMMDSIRSADLVIELCDARLPWSSRNPEIGAMIGEKRHLLFLNKSDLASREGNAAWLAAFKQRYIDAYLTNAQKIRGQETIQTIQRATQEIVERARKRGIRKTVRVMVAGVPNVGKSTLINRLRGSGIAQTGDRPGVTRSQQWVKIGPYLELLDTPGLLWPRLEDQEAAKRLCYIGTVSDEVVDLHALTISLLEELEDLVPDLLKERLHLDRTDLKGMELLEAVCRGRGWLMKGNQFDYERCYRVVMDEFRGGKLGKLTLEMPEQFFT